MEITRYPASRKPAVTVALLTLLVSVSNGVAGDWVRAAISVAVGLTLLFLLSGRAIETDDVGLTIRRRFSERQLRWEEIGDFGANRGGRAGLRAVGWLLLSPLFIAMSQSGVPTVYLRSEGPGLPNELVKVPTGFSFTSNDFALVMVDRLKASAGPNLLAMIGSGRIDLGAVSINSSGLTVPAFPTETTIGRDKMEGTTYEFRGPRLILSVPGKRRPKKVRILLNRLTHIAAFVGYLDNLPSERLHPQPVRAVEARVDPFAV